MRARFVELARIGMLVAAGLVLAACSKGDGARILGHWRAEAVKVSSFNIPVGPDLVITRHKLRTLDMDIPIASISEKGSEIVLNGVAGLGLSFYFEGSDRMYLDLPLIEKIYYQRVEDTPSAGQAGPTGTKSMPPVAEMPLKPDPRNISLAPMEPQVTPAVANAGIPRGVEVDFARQAETRTERSRQAEAQGMLSRGKVQEDGNAMADYDLAVGSMRQSDAEGAIHHLADAFGHGFRAFDLLDASADMASLKADVRYQALVARYK